MKLHQLQVFRAVADHASYSRAAEAVHLTQPAVSMQVRALEREFGTALFERVGRTLRLTEAGRELYAYAQRIADLVGEAELVMQELAGLERGRVTIAAVSTAGAYVLPPLLGAFRREHPGITVSLEVTNRATVQRRLLENEVDLVVMGRPPEGVPHVADPFLADEMVLIAAPSHPLAGARRIPLERIEREVLVMRELGSGTRLAAEEFFREAGLTISVGFELGDNSAVKEAVAADLGVAVISKHALRMELRLGRLVVLDVEGFPLRRQWHVARREDKRLSRAAAAFEAFLVTSAEAAVGDL